MITAELTAERCFDGWQKRFRHSSVILNAEVCFSIYLPPQAKLHPVPVLYWLCDSGEDDRALFATYTAQQHAAKLGLALVGVAPGSVPRLAALSAQLGLTQPQLCYVNATQNPWAKHFRLFDYLQYELPQLIETHFPVNDRRSVGGFGVGAHGALVLGLSNPQRYCAVSGFDPIFKPAQYPALCDLLSVLLGDNSSSWQQYDVTELLNLSLSQLPILLYQSGSSYGDIVAREQQQCRRVAEVKGYPFELIRMPGYAPGTGFTASFIARQLKFHSLYL